MERQIDYGAKLGQVVLSLARMELNNFYKNVMPVADYFDQSNMLIAVSKKTKKKHVQSNCFYSVCCYKFLILNKLLRRSSPRALLNKTKKKREIVIN